LVIALDLDKRMAELSSSNKPQDISALAYFGGFPLVIVKRLAVFATGPKVLTGRRRGPENGINHVRVFPDANFTDSVRPNVDTFVFYCTYRLNGRTACTSSSPITDRYYSLQFVDAYSNNFLYIGSRTNDTTEGIYLISRPNWQKDVLPLI
jgi:hypothetical protein